MPRELSLLVIDKKKNFNQYYLRLDQPSTAMQWQYMFKFVLFLFSSILDYCCAIVLYYKRIIIIKKLEITFIYSLIFSFNCCEWIILIKYLPLFNQIHQVFSQHFLCLLYNSFKTILIIYFTYTICNKTHFLRGKELIS